jgi:hypothetical protein
MKSISATPASKFNLKLVTLNVTNAKVLVNSAGLNNPQRVLFEDIAWSTENVLKQTIERAQQINLSIHFLPSWYDVDDRWTLQRLCVEFFNPSEGTTPGYPAPTTRSYLERLLQQEGRDRIWPLQDTGSKEAVN